MYNIPLKNIYSQKKVSHSPKEDNGTVNKREMQIQQWYKKCQANTAIQTKEKGTVVL